MVVRVGAGAKVERNDRETTLATFQVGDFAEARTQADGTATRIEATCP